ncbi:MAG TPA: hypothetical protein VMZ53_26350 [Kofleriaceae bacterium]|nr:hypothetical protein [Kofleriaceae bacterium]
MRALVVCAALLAGCVNHSQVGPYVKSVSRADNSLMVIRCMIELVGEDLREGTCERLYVPLGSMPLVPPPPMQPPPQMK